VTVGSSPATSALRPTRIAGFGGAAPETVVSAARLVEPFGKTAEWLLARTGITEVRRLAPDESLVDLAGAAATRALVDAAVTTDEVDTVLVATCSVVDGALAHRVAAKVAPHAMAFDLNSACAGFCYAISVAHGLVATGSTDTVLVVGAEQMSRIVNPADLGTSILFGDGAGAAVVTTAPDVSIGPAAWRSFGDKAGVLDTDPEHGWLRMDGRQVFRWALDEVHAVARDALDRAGVRAEDIDVFVPHQANLRIIEGIARRLGLTGAITATDVVDSGNTSAASIPMAVARLRATGRTVGGELALLVGYGAGLSIAAQVVRLP
jgi:3-oxoacyl-[acyl-carrier-protein] synthase-3